MLKYLFVFLSLCAVAFAMPSFIHTAPVVTTYHAVPTVHVVRPIVATHRVITPVVHTHHIGYGIHALH